MNSLKKVLCLLALVASVNTTLARLPREHSETKLLETALQTPTALKKLLDLEKAVEHGISLSARIKSEEEEEKWKDDVQVLINKTATFAALLEAQLDVARFLVEKSLEETYKDSPEENAVQIAKEKSLLIKYINALVEADEAGESPISPSKFLAEYLISEGEIKTDQVVEFCKECGDVFNQVRESLTDKAQKRYELIKKKMARK